MIDEQIKVYYGCEVKNLTLQKGVLVEDEGFGDCYNFIKEALLLISKDPGFLLKLIDQNADRADAAKLIHPFVNILY